jgi:hypothetical protein
MEISWKSLCTIKMHELKKKRMKKKPGLKVTGCMVPLLTCSGKNGTSGTENAWLPAVGSGGWMGMEGAQTKLQADGTVPCPGCGGNFPTVYIRQSSQNCTLTKVSFTVHEVNLNKHD